MTVGLMSVLALSLVACSSGTPPTEPTTAGTSGSASADPVATSNYPDRNITLIIPYAAGGSFDPVGRLFASLMEKELGVSVLPQNMPGAAATLGTNTVLDADPDGYTIGLSSGSAAGFQPLISDAGYSGVEEIQGIAKVGDSIEALAVNINSRWQTINDFIEEAKASPNTLKIGVAGELSSGDLRVSMIENALDVTFVHVPHADGTGAALTSLLANRVDAMILDVGIAAPQEGTELRTLAVMSDEPAAVLPDVPTMSSAGYDLPGSSGQLYFVFGPMGMPDDVLNRLEEASLKAIESAEFTKFLDDSGIMAEALGVDGTNDDLKANQDAYVELVEILGLERQ